MKTMKGLSVGLCLLMTSFVSAQTLKETKTVTPFKSIEVSEGIDVKFTQADTYSLVLEGKKEDIDKMEWNVTSGKLKIKRKKNQRFSNNGKTVAHITAPEIESVGVSGGSDFEAKKIHLTKNLSLAASGGSDIEINSLKASAIDISFSGGSDCEIDLLEASAVNISTSGGSDVDIHFEKSGAVNVAASGGSDAKLSGTVESINLNCSGGSDANIKNLTYSTIDIKNDISSDVSK